MNQLIEIYLQKLEIVDNGIGESKNERNFLSANTILPRLGIPSQEHFIDLNIGDLSSTDLSESPLVGRLLFTGKIEGTAYFQLDLTAKISKAKINRILKLAFTAGVIAGLSTISGGLGLTVLIGTGKSIIESVFKEAKEEGEINSIGLTNFDFDNSIEAREYRLPLIIQKEVTIKEKRDGKLINKTLRKGFKNGYVTIQVKKSISENNPTQQPIILASNNV